MLIIVVVRIVCLLGGLPECMRDYSSTIGIWLEPRSEGFARRDYL